MLQPIRSVSSLFFFCQGEDGMRCHCVTGVQTCALPISDTELVEEAFPIPEHWPRAYGLDIRWNTVAAIWGARDPQSDVLYLYSEYLAESDPAIHAAAIRSRGGWVHGLIDVTANGRVQADGFRLIETYRDL